MAGYKNNDRHEEESLLGKHRDRRSSAKSSPAVKSRRWTIASLFALLALVSVAAVHMVNGYEPSREVTLVERARPDLLVVSASSSQTNKNAHRSRACNSVKGGYQCFSGISHRWGQYSPYFSLADAGVSNTVPEKCDVTFVQVLSRHGARYPTASKSKKYKALIKAIQANATAFQGKAAFLKSYNYTLGSDDLTTFGERQMVSSGIKFYQSYKKALTRDHVPFIRSSDSSRVVESGRFFIQGFQQSKLQDRAADHTQANATINVVISEDTGANNTLNHNTCPAFEASTLGDDVSENYTSIIAPSMAQRIQSNLPGVTLTNDEVIYLMDMCAYDTIATTPDASQVSSFCALFTEAEWSQYNYLQSLGKYYGYGAGNPLGPTQDDTTTNHTIDAPGAASFPVNRTLYADFTHDNGMIPIFFAMGLYNGTAPLPQDHIQSEAQADGYSAAWTVPFAARAYIEMMQCSCSAEPLVRVLVNDRVVPLHGCNADKLGRCRRSDFVRALSFARSGGDWASCYTS
ncbi:Histidine phosphatase superfamilyclade-2 [Penicillium daleae]|uniref:Phytase A n=1 Tax=Penicillium daleae TaxID=63821 RepID=A0AAD6CH65_9EURO|nr:Histidine phosphatase superfamilyclade-2 [Penicillium daleae]KAJ5465038.1 Histidine phosphatase superfamilyclade-2 [Penicillium daleae]